jgi:hypothetical protein
VTGADHLFPLLARGNPEVVRRVFAEATGFRYDSGLDHPASDEYLEAQVHGDVEWTDIDLIRLIASDEEELGTYGDYARRLKAFAAEHGLFFRVELLTAEDIERLTNRPPGEGMDRDDAVGFHTDRLGVLLAAKAVHESKVHEHIEQLKSLLTPCTPRALEAAFPASPQNDGFFGRLAAALRSGRLSSEGYRRVLHTADASVLKQPVQETSRGDGSSEDQKHG